MGNQTSQPVVKKTVRRVVKKRPPPVQQSIYSQPIPQQKPEVQTPQQFVQPPVREMNALMPRPQGTKSMGIMDVNDRIKEFKNTQKTEEQDFLRNLENQKQNFYHEQKSKEDKFQEELQEFEKNYNPFRILHLDYNASEDDIKKAYRKFSLKYHPDRPNGNSKKFMMVTQAYVYLMEKIKQMKGNSSHNDLRNQAKNYFEEMESKRVSQPKQIDDIEDQMEIGEKNFDQDKFNKIFEKNRMPTNYDKGYGGSWGDDSDNEEEVVMDKKFTLDVFNSVFQDQKKKREERKPGRQMIAIEEPEAAISSNLAYETLGQGEIGDFSSSHTDNMAFTDFKAAYTKNNVLEYDEKYNRGDYKNLDALVRSRDGQNFDVTPEDQRFLDRREQRMKNQEEERIKNLMGYDQMAEQYHQRANQYFIKNK